MMCEMAALGIDPEPIDEVYLSLPVWFLDEANLFDCIVAAENRHCTVALAAEPQHIVGGTGRSRMIQSAETVGCGTQQKPWSIESLAGQRIAVSLTEFGE